MNLLLFLGSGVSFPSGLPGVANLTDRILHGTYHKNADGEFRPGNHPDSNVQTEDITPALQRFLSLLVVQDERYRQSCTGYYTSDGSYRQTGLVDRTSTTYEDLYYLSEQISESTLGRLDNAAVGPFVQLVEREAIEALAELRKEEPKRCFSVLAGEACRFIEAVVAMSLRTERVVGFDVIIELANSPRIDRLDIITLNHDTLVEQILAENGVNFLDGFGEPDGDVRWYDNAVYDTPDEKVRLFKLHGSVNWYRFSPTGTKQFAIPITTDVFDLRNGVGQFLRPVIKRPRFLSGGNKVISYNSGIYADTHFRFHQVLRDSHLMLMSGYGWGDTAISHRLDTWLDYNKRNTIILLHKDDPEELMQRSLVFASMYNGAVEAGQMVPINKWLCHTRLCELEDVLSRITVTHA